MADKLGLGTEVRELKLGPSFTNKKSTAFHTLKYDFKPASVDVSKMAQVDVGTNATMTVTVPHSDGAGTPHTVFKGSQRPYHKECVLIIDRITGEVTLEKLSSNIQVKKTRTEPKSQSFLSIPGQNSNNRPFTPVEIRRSPTHGRANGRTKVASGKKREPSFQHHPKQHSPLQASPYHAKSPPDICSSSSPVPPSNNPSTLASLPMIGLDSDDFGLSSMTTPAQPLPHNSAPPRTELPVIRERIIEENAPAPAQATAPAPVSVPAPASASAPAPAPAPAPISAVESDEGALSDTSSSSSSSDSSDSDSDAENVPVPMATNGHSNGTASPSLSMPDNLLKDDLQLSESGSDSD